VKSKAPTPQQVYEYASGFDPDGVKNPTIAQAARHFGCTQQQVRDAIDSHDNRAQYLGLAVAIKAGSGYFELHGGSQEIEAYPA
jgi:hypothetical protein